MALISFIENLKENKLRDLEISKTLSTWTSPACACNYMLMWGPYHGETVSGNRVTLSVLLNAQICASIAYARNYSDKQT